MFPKSIIFTPLCRFDVISNGKLSVKKNRKKIKFNEFNENKQEAKANENAEIAKISKFY